MTYIISDAYERISSERLEEAEAEVTLYRHIKTGARLMHFACEDDNKVFCISFRTPSENSCGTAHIIEHSVLCGSDKYPLKDPFVHLLKGSLNTFLNAMTYPDKTMYPVASRNESDFKNLMSVYLDAVFNPLIKHNKNTFYQEGWHYHLTDKEAPLTVNGIVYNEMKGAFSDPEEVIGRFSQSSLYPDTSYSYESGGDPEVIPELSYEKFIDYYTRYYHPSNSYIFLYGDMQPEEYMRMIDTEYLSKYDKLDIDSLPRLQPDFPSRAELDIKYPCDGDCEDKYYYSLNYKVGDSSDVFLAGAFNVLVKILFDTDASPLKHALSEAGFAEETDCDYHTGLREPIFTITAKNASKEAGELFKKTVFDTLSQLVKNGIDGEIITACLNNYEFDLREADSGNYPKGLVYIADSIMESWLYDCDPLAFMRYEPIIKKLRENENSAFYTALIQKYILNNDNSSFISLIPDETLGEQREKAFADKLKAYKNSLTDKQLENIINETKLLEKLQSEPDCAEAVASIPVLNLSEISDKPQKYELDIDGVNNAKIYKYTDNCSDIVYADIFFDIGAFSAEELPALELLGKMIGVYATQNYSELDLSNETGKYLGDVDVNISTYQSFANIDAFEKKFMFSVKALAKNTSDMFRLTEEMLCRTLINTAPRLKQTVGEEISKFESSLLSSCESFVNGRISAMSTRRGAFTEKLKGLNYYRYLIGFKEKLDKGDNSCLEAINGVYKKLINSYKTDILITCDARNMNAAETEAKKLIAAFPDRAFSSAAALLTEPKINEGIITLSGVCYAGLGTNFKTLGCAYPAQLAVARKYLRTGYLWENIRVKGGAYGAIMGADQSGDIYFISYRDPQLKNTYRIYDGIASALKEASFSESELQKLIIGTVSDIDSPIPVYNRGRRALYDIYRNNSYESQCAVRQSILSCKASDINEIASLAECAVKGGVKVGAGFAGAVNECKDMFDNIYSVKRTQR